MGKPILCSLAEICSIVKSSTNTVDSSNDDDWERARYSIIEDVDNDFLVAQTR